MRQEIWCDRWIVKFGERIFRTKHSHCNSLIWNLAIAVSHSASCTQSIAPSFRASTSRSPIVRPCLFPIIISLSLEISDNPTKRLDYFRFSGNPLQRFELREARFEKRENLRFSRPRLDYKLSKNKQGQHSLHWYDCRGEIKLASYCILHVCVGVLFIPTLCETTVIHIHWTHWLIKKNLWPQIGSPLDLQLQILICLKLRLWELECQSQRY